MSHLPLDARAILEYLNELGYRNITAAQLKEFIKDLRKLIKYEESMGVNVHQRDYFDNLYRKTTASFRAKSDAAVTADDDNNGLRRDGMISSHSKMNADKENNLRKKMVNMEKQVRQENDGMLQQHGVRSGVLRDHKQQEQQHQKPSSKQEASGCSKMTISSTKRRQTLPAPAKPNTAGTSTARTSRATEKSSNAMCEDPTTFTFKNSPLCSSHKDGSRSIVSILPTRMGEIQNKSSRRIKSL
ncbi:uncharacterized protein LOC129915815 isoform X2 [Episyrphus balteatus]|uniref:uncharacterized protein LOC129915815 isoform X2 n=1 Tax=Episyrphus balteatus TaxID=286459 RepID=UPI00248544D0|nr:uncharacterized protein LOC129915815 isoform X2 [Episyrphus balteatus]